MKIGIKRTSVAIGLNTGNIASIKLPKITDKIIAGELAETNKDLRKIEFEKENENKLYNGMQHRFKIPKTIPKRFVNKDFTKFNIIFTPVIFFLLFTL